MKNEKYRNDGDDRQRNDDEKKYDNKSMNVYVHACRALMKCDGDGDKENE